MFLGISALLVILFEFVVGKVDVSLFCSGTFAVFLTVASLLFVNIFK